MHKYILKRVLMLIPIILGVSFIVFFMMDSAQGNALDIIGVDYSTEKLEELFREATGDVTTAFKEKVFNYEDMLKNLKGKDFKKTIIDTLKATAKAA